MKVAAFTPQYLPVVGGIEIFVDALCGRLRRFGVETIVITETDPRGRLPLRDVVNDTVIHRLNFFEAVRSLEPGGPLNVLQQLSTLLDREKPDLIHVHSAVQFSAWYLARLLPKTPKRLPLVVTQHGALAPVDHLKSVKELLLRADVVTAVSKAALLSAVAYSQRNSASTVIYNGVERTQIAARVEQTKERRRLVCVGRLEPEKGFDLAISALALVRSQGIDTELVIVGGGAERAALHWLAGAQGLGDYVRFEGVLAHHATVEIISSADLIVIPSRLREGFSLVAVEAAMFGVPCIATRVGGLPEVVEDRVTGLLIPPDDANILALAIAELIGNPELLNLMGANARRRAEKKFDMDRCAGEYLTLYRSLVQ